MNNTILAVVVALLVGGGAGYGIARYEAPEVPVRAGVGGEAPAASGGHSMNSSMTGMIDGLKSASGEDRDIAFLEGMIVHHQGAVEMATIVAQSTKRPELKQAAESIISAQTAEIATFETWLQQWFGR